jgi:predicted HicB family RNase H-like nuclease
MPKPKTKAAEYKRVTIRLPEEILELLQKQAKTQERPLNTQVIKVLRHGLGIDKSPAPLAS